MVLTLTEISIPAMSTVGYGRGLDEDGNEVRFAGDQRPMRDLGQMLMHLNDDDEPVMVEVEDWQILPEVPR